MIIPGFLISILTFPGVIVHEIAHQLFCRWARVAVFNVCYFRVGNPAGFVIHETPRTTWQHLLISIGPFFVNTLLGALIAFPAILPLIKFNDADPLNLLLAWLGVSIAMHAFPSTGDAKSMYGALKTPGVSWLTQIVGFPLIALIYLGAVGSFFWLDAIYGFVVCMAVPTLIVAVLQ